jgi:hypothetical protein
MKKLLLILLLCPWVSAMEISPQVDQILRVLNSNKFEVVEVYYDFSRKGQDYIGLIKIQKGENLTDILASIEEKPGFQRWDCVVLEENKGCYQVKL